MYSISVWLDVVIVFLNNGSEGQPQQEIGGVVNTAGAIVLNTRVREGKENRRAEGELIS